MKQLKNKLQSIVNNKQVQSFIKARISKTAFAVLIAIATTTGLIYTSDITTNGIKATIAENGGGFIQDLYQDDENINTGLVIVEEESEAVQGNDLFIANDLPHLNDVKDIDDWRYERWQEYGTCVYETMNITTIQALRLLGLWNIDDKVVLDINHGYFDKVYEPGKDTGEVPDWAFDKYKEDGLPIETTYQHEKEDTVRFIDALDAKDEDAYKFTITAPYTKVAEGNGADSFFIAYQELIEAGETPLFEISISNLNNVHWYGIETPYIKSNIRDARSGGHRMSGNAFMKIFEYKGEPAVAIHNSEARSGVDMHLARLSILRLNMNSWDIYLVDVAEQVTTPPASSILASERIVFGNGGDSVVELQNYLISQNISIPAGATGFFGNQTKVALKEWQDEQFGNVYDGTVWGSISQRRFVDLQML